MHSSQEAEIEHRTLALKREGYWSLKRLSRIPEPVRPKVHWDYLCEEMQWLSADFAQERRWKRGVARKVRESTVSSLLKCDISHLKALNNLNLSSGSTDGDAPPRGA